MYSTEKEFEISMISMGRMLVLSLVAVLAMACGDNAQTGIGNGQNGGSGGTTTVTTMVPICPTNNGFANIVNANHCAPNIKVGVQPTLTPVCSITANASDYMLVADGNIPGQNATCWAAETCLDLFAGGIINFNPGGIWQLRGTCILTECHAACYANTGTSPVLTDALLTTGGTLVGASTNPQNGLELQGLPSCPSDQEVVVQCTVAPGP